MKKENLIAEFMNNFTKYYQTYSEIRTYVDVDKVYKLSIRDMYNCSEDDIKIIEEYYLGNKEDLIQICLGNL